MKTIHLLALALLVGTGCGILPNFGSRCSKEAVSDYELRLIENHHADSVSVRGRVIDIQNGEAIPGASIFVKRDTEEDTSRRVAETNISGRFEFDLQPGRYSIIARFVGYEPAETRKVTLSNGSAWHLKYELECNVMHFQS